MASPKGTCVSTINPRDGVRKIGSIGLALPGQEVVILDEEGNEQPPNERGEICIKGDNVMKGYFNKPEETAETIVDGYLHTGDVGIKDEDGYIFIVDRKKDMIIRGGENIYPKEIDNFLATHPKIPEVATVGVPDKTMGEEVKVFVIALEDDPSPKKTSSISANKTWPRSKSPGMWRSWRTIFPGAPLARCSKRSCANGD